jgi:hypothetical protein
MQRGLIEYLRQAPPEPERAGGVTRNQATQP